MRRRSAAWFWAWFDGYGPIYACLVYACLLYSYAVVAAYSG